MGLFLIFVALIGGIGLYIYQKKTLADQNANKLSGHTQKDKAKDIAGDAEIIERKSFLSTLASHEYAQRYLKPIDFDKKSLVKMSTLRLKALRAGIRDSQEHRILAVSMIALAIIFAVIGYFIPNLLFKEEQTKAIHILFAFGGGMLGYYFPIIRLDSMGEERREAFSLHFPDMLDLMIVCVEAGMAAEQTFIKMAEEFHENAPVLSEEISILSAELTYFLDSTVAYENLQRRVDYTHIRAFCSALIQAKRFGTPLAKSLKALSHEIRESQMAQVERKAASLPAKLTVPMMLFTLPVLLTVILSPAAIKLMS